VAMAEESHLQRRWYYAVAVWESRTPPDLKETGLPESAAPSSFLRGTKERDTS
jgi:hypothetical protein